MLALSKDLLHRRKAIFELARRDFQQQFYGSYLGLFWAIFQPLLFIATLYLIFELGFRAGRKAELAFSVYLISGMISWVYFSNNLSATAGVFKGHAFLIKKVDFRLSVLPLVKLLSATPIHLLLVLVAIGLAWLEGYPPTLYTLQLIYYFTGLCMLLFGLGLITASTSLFAKDVLSMVSIVVQFGFWFTPIFWSIQMLPETYQDLIKYNPMYYVVSGYRNSIALQQGFWERPYETLYFWSLVLFFQASGISVYKKLKPHFAEVV